MTVLVVESQDWLRDRLVRWIGEAGFEVLACPGPQGPDFRCAAAGRSGCPLAESADVLVLDLELESDLLVCGVAAWELLHYYRSLDKPVVLLCGIEDPIRPLPGDRVSVLRRLPDRDELVEALHVLVLNKQLHPTAEPETIPDVLVPGGSRDSSDRTPAWRR